MATDIKNDSNLSVDLVSFWELEEASGTRVDSHGTNDLDNGSAGQTTSGIQGNAADFERGNSDELYRLEANLTGIHSVTDFSISAWIQVESEPSTGEQRYIVSKWGPDNNGDRCFILFYRNSSGTKRIGVIARNASANGTTVHYYDIELSLSTWYHLVATFDGSTGRVELWVDGVNVGGTTGTADGTGDKGDFYIGNSEAGGVWFDGFIDEVGFWSRILSSSEISDLYNSGSGIPYDAGGGSPSQAAARRAVFFGV